MAKQVKKTELEVINFEKFSVTQLPELQGKKEEINAIIEANPAIEVIDNSTYELAKKSRTAVKSLRTGLEKEQKDVKKKIKELVLDVVDNEYSTLILGVKNQEIIRQEPITIWEDKKEEERLEKIRLEELRIKNIKIKIDHFKQGWEGLINILKFEGIQDCQQSFTNTISDFGRASLQEFDILFDDAVSYLTNLLNAKISTLTEQENIRLDQIRLAEEREALRIESERQAELQRLESEKIAEAQRLEREKFEAEQKAIAEKQRIAMEEFAKEKAEFQKAQAEAEAKRISEIEVIIVAENKIEEVAKAIEDKISADEVAFFPTELTGVFSTEPREDYHEEDVHEIATSKPIQKEVAIISWESILEEFNESGRLRSPMAFIDWLNKTYNVPTKR